MVEPTWPSLMAALLRGEELSAEQTAWAMGEIMAGRATLAQIAGFVTGLRAKGETAAEIAGLASAMLARAEPVPLPAGVRAVDVVGTGGDRAHTVNVSTMAAIVTAAAGARVVKHGNRAASSSCGAADVLEHLGVALDHTPVNTARIAAEAGIAFCFAPVYHPAFRFVGPARREIGVPTVFNFLGPLTNPARPTSQAIGVFDARMLPVVAGVFAERGVSAVVFRGDDGLDELTIGTTSTVFVVRDGEAVQTKFDPAVLGIPRAEPDALKGGDVAYNAQAVRDVLAGRSGPVRDAVLLNAAAALAAVDGAGKEFTDAMAEGYERATRAVDSGAAAETLERWIEISRALKSS